MFYYFCFIVLLLPLTESLTWTFEKGLKVFQEFGIKHPLVLSDRVGDNIYLMKQLSNYDQYSSTSVYMNKSLNHESTIINQVTDIDAIKHFIKENRIIYITNKTTFELVYPHLTINVGQHFYFMIEPTYEVFEAYDINNEKIMKKLGQLAIDSSKFVWSINKNFIERRGNFNGLVLKAIVEVEHPSVILDPMFKKKSKYFQENDTFLVNGFASGTFIDILSILQEQLNFTTLLFKRNVVSGGFVEELENGTIVATGMVGDIYFKRADLIVANLAILPRRAKYIDFFPPLKTSIEGIYVPNMNTADSFELGTYLKPLTPNLWIVLLVIALVTSCIKLLILIHHDHNHKPRGYYFYNVCQFIWNSMKSNFGGRPSTTKMDAIGSYRLVIFFSLIVGTIIWISYRSFLTALLSVTQKNYPFQDLESLAKTDWRLVTFGKNTATGDFFINAKDGSPVQKVFQNNMDKDSFQPSKEKALSLTWSDTKTALYWFKEDIQSDEDTFCKFEEVWTHINGQGSMASTKGLPFTKFMTLKLFEIMENGQLNQLMQKWKVKEPACEDEITVKPLGFRKMTSLFVLIGIGIVIAALVFLIENVMSEKSPPNDNKLMINKLKFHFIGIEQVLEQEEYSRDENLMKQYFSLKEKLHL